MLVLESNAGLAEPDANSPEGTISRGIVSQMQTLASFHFTKNQTEAVLRVRRS